MRKAFTLMEVNLAIMIMAGGLLSVLGLYSLGYRESRQGRTDVETSACADAVLAPLVMALSATNMTWTSFDSIRDNPSERWGGYVSDDGSWRGGGKASTVYGYVMGKSPSDAKVSWNEAFRQQDLFPGLVVMRDPGSPVVRIAFRASGRKSDFLSSPMYYTEVAFQGDPDR